MVNDLEYIPMKAVISESGESYASFRKSLVPKYGVVWRDISLGYFFVGLSLLSALYLERIYNQNTFVILLFPFIGVLIAFWVANIQLFVHEAAHHNIHPNKKINDSLANFFLGWLTGLNIEAYRKTHWKHHQNLGQIGDTENSYFNGLTFTFLLKVFTGLHVLSILKNRNRLESGQTVASNRLQKIALVQGMVFHLVILSLLFFNGYIFTGLTWIISIGVFYPFFATIRQLLEHRDEKAKKTENFFKVNHGKVSRLFQDGAFAFFFGGAGFNRHLIHHWDPSVSYTRLAEVENFLEKTGTCGEIIRASRTTYLKTFLQLIK
jgi:fatty acid desaturase